MAKGLLDKHLRKTNRALINCWTWVIPGQEAADLVDILIWDSGPNDVVLVEASAVAENVSGTNVTLDLLDDGVSVLSAVADMKSAAEKTVIPFALDAAKLVIENGSKMSVNLVCNTSTPQLDNCTITIWWRTKAEDETE